MSSVAFWIGAASKTPVWNQEYIILVTVLSRVAFATFEIASSDQAKFCIG